VEAGIHVHFLRKCRVTCVGFWGNRRRGNERRKARERGGHSLLCSLALSSLFSRLPLPRLQCYRVTAGSETPSRPVGLSALKPIPLPPSRGFKFSSGILPSRAASVERWDLGSVSPRFDLFFLFFSHFVSVLKRRVLVLSLEMQC
jgi:hypothetical protein